EEPLLRWETRPLGQRPSAAAENLLLDMEYLVAHHHERLSRSPEALSNCHAQAGVAAARLGRYREARRHFARGARAHPRNPKHWLRLTVATVPPLGNRVWRPPGLRHAVVRWIRRPRQRRGQRGAETAGCSRPPFDVGARRPSLPAMTTRPAKRRLPDPGAVHDEREIEAVVEVLRTSNLALGAKVAEFE